MSDVDIAHGEWLLFATFRGGVSGLIARGGDLQIPPGETGIQDLKRLRLPAVLKNDLLEPAILGAVAAKRIYRLTHPLRGQQVHAFADPVISGTGRVHAVWVWIGQSELPPFWHVRTGAWEWITPKYVAIYGPGIDEIYGRFDRAVGQEYPIDETINALHEPDLQSGARILHDGQDGLGWPMRYEIDRPGRDGQDGLATIRAYAEIVAGDDGHQLLGVTWDVTGVDPPSGSLTRALLNRFARETTGWNCLLWWDIGTPGLIITANWVDGRTPEIVWIDPDTNRVRMHDDTRHDIRQMLNDIDSHGSLTTTVRLWGTDEQWHSFELAAERLPTTVGPPVASVAMIKIVAEPD